MAQFFEVRYSRRFRVFTGLLAWIAGIINFGIFPAVGATFFIYFCGLPESVTLLGMSISTFPLVIVVLLSFALFFTFVGGQIAVIVTDFIQGVFCSFFIAILIVFVLVTFDWSQITGALATAPEHASKLNPFHTSEAKDFNIWFYLIAAFGLFYHYLAWQGNQGYNASAESPHEAKMGKILSTWRELPLNAFTVILAVCAFTILNCQDFAIYAEKANAITETIGNETLRTQVTVPLVLSQFLPPGIMGGFCAVMLAMFISTHDTYLHSWGTIFIQDVVMPFRKKPLTPAQHIKLLRFSIFLVAVFIFAFSLIFRQTEYILMFFAITGAIFLAGAGSVIIGGLYWKRGTTAAAWTAMITGAVLASSSVIVKQFPDVTLNESGQLLMTFKQIIQFIQQTNGQILYFFAMLSSISIYIIVSLLGKKKKFNLDTMLHRKQYAVAGDETSGDTMPRRGLRGLLSMSEKFTRGDKIIYAGTIIWNLLWAGMFVIVTVYNLIFDVKDESWANFWYFYIILSLFFSVLVAVWFSIGGFSNLKYMFRKLNTMERDDSDDGTVISHHDENVSDS